MISKRDRLISLLRQYAIAEEEHLHDGRVMVPDKRVDEVYADKITALFGDEHDPIHLEALDEIKRLTSEASLFERIMTASADYVARMGGTLEFQGAIRKMYEEQREFEIALIAYTQALTDDTPMSMRLKTPHQLKREMLREYVDFMVTAGGVFAVLGIDMADIQQATIDTLAKLDARTTETHQWNEQTKTIERIGKTQTPTSDADFHISSQLQAIGREHTRTPHRED